MDTVLEFRNLERDVDQWKKLIDASVNPIPAKDLEVAQGPNGELLFTNSSDTAYGGGLIARHLPFPNIPLPYISLSLEFYVSAWDLPFLARLETDLIGTNASCPAGTPAIQNKFDGSAQLNLSRNGGTWQIDKDTVDATTNPATSKASWTDTPYAPGTPKADVWTPLIIRHFHDAANKQASVLSIAQGGDAPSLIPATMQGQPMLFSNWASGLHVQLQTEAIKAGVVRVLYRNVNVRMASAASLL